jgi:serine/threonine protein kinase
MVGRDDEHEADTLATTAASTGHCAQLPQFGQTLHGYTLEGELGRGSHGVVFLGVGPQGERVALKVLRKLDERHVERLRREALALRQLKHPGIVRLHEAFVEEEPPLLILDYVHGQTLARRLKDPGVEVEEKLDLLAQVGRAIHFAHQSQIVHRDLKPANVLVCGGVAKVTDFGHAINLDRATRLTETGASIGTPLYMAPEQVRQGSKLAGPSVDTYSLGVMLYEALTGRVAHEGASLVEQQENLLKLLPEPPSRLNPRLGPDHDRVCMKALAKCPEERYPTALALAQHIELLRHGEPIPRAPAQRSLWRLLPWGLAAALALGWALSWNSPVAPSAGPAQPATPQPVERPTNELPAEQPASSPKLVALDEIPRLSGQSLRLGTYVTVERGGRWQVAVIVGDGGDSGYDLVFGDGESIRSAEPTGLLPDVFMVGAECHAKQGGRPELPGVVLERRGQAALVSLKGERNWLPVGLLWLQAGQRVPLSPAPPEEARLLLARYRKGQVSYPAVELDRESERSWLMYLGDGDLEWRGPDNLAALPGPGATIFFGPFAGKKSVSAEVVALQGGVVRVKVASGKERWISLGQVQVRR